MHKTLANDLSFRHPGDLAIDSTRVPIARSRARSKAISRRRRGSAAHPLAFLDIDDVVCQCRRYGGLAALGVLRGKRDDGDAVFAELFAPECREVLEGIHREFEHLRYVISSTWRQYFNRQELQEALRRGGLGFVADAMFEDERWCTPTSRCGFRHVEIKEWLRRHHRGQPWVIIDDTLSGGDLPHVRGWQPHLVLCEPGVGLCEEHGEQIVRALRAQQRGRK